MYDKNIIVSADSYKLSMPFQYPPGTEGVFSYIEARSSPFRSSATYDECLDPVVVFFGLQMFLMEYLTKPVTKEDVTFGDVFWKAHGVPFYRQGWEHIVNKHGGYLPVRIRAVPEGTVLGPRKVLATVENTDPACWWLTTHLETALLRAVWYPTTVCTLSYHIKMTIKGFLDATADNTLGLQFKLHDFGCRGVSSRESAAIGGAAHLVNFMGTDTPDGILAAMYYYDADVCGYSIPAAEHSTITAWGRDRETDAYRNMLDRFAKPGSVVAVVSDSYDIYNAVENIWGGTLRDQVINSGALVVIRPDSGEPVEVSMDVVETLAAKFGVTVNQKGYKVLNNVRVIYGDGIDDFTIVSILSELMRNGYSADNIAFGMGGALLQRVDRDTLSFAMKASAVKINGVWNPISKDPATDHRKASKGGRVDLIKTPAGLVSGLEGDGESALVTVFENGRLYNTSTFSEIRARANVH